MTAPSRVPQAGPPQVGWSASTLLAIETAGSSCSAAVLRGRETLAVECCALRHGHAEALLPMVDRVARAAGVKPGELELVAAATGPGGFTGIRAGLAAAHGIALASGARLVGVTGFAAVAAAVRGRSEAGAARVLLVALDSRRDDFYVQLFAADWATPLAEPASVLPGRLASYVAGLIGGAPLLVAGDLAGPAADTLAQDRPVGLIPASAPDALGVAAAALFELETGATDEPVRPLYLRSPDATLPKQNQLGSAAVR